MNTNPEPKLPESDLPESAVRRQTLKAFGLFALAATVPIGVYLWIKNSPNLYGAKKPLRRVLDANETIARTYFSNANLVKTYPLDRAAKQPRQNGYDGLRTPLPADWKLHVDRDEQNPLYLTMDDIRTLPKHELVYDFKCVEGWSQIQHWGGARLADFLERYKLGTKPGNASELFEYVGLETPDKGYYVGIDMASALHSQTLLAYELNGQPISNAHGAPVRLIIPHKYGVKNLKRIGRIFFSDTRPRDFWAERGYDYYLGL
ncbi:molybdopterin-binding oxidoreductase [Spirosoma montaniterrae]|uniref:Molybdopterin-binding oxidoreductase n=1 Tax=Spirosoma montaniterrae TaxID=1178516 RepID=A0A1P9X509_9BACT|nr:molybdopterin-binding oxidoreductase [Spirosoma montaniterrae]